MKDNSDKMLSQLAAFREEHGHCNVPTNDAKYPQLGRWVAAQRYKRKIGALPGDQVERLNEMGFVWSPSEEAWKRMLEELQAFKRAHGNTNVPEQWSENRRLANWVQSQRHRKRKGKLSSERIQMLDAIDFAWAIYKNDEVRSAPVVEKVEEPPPPEPAQERLYAIRNGLYVQYGGVGAMPPALEQYVAEHAGECPPYMPLPSGETDFFLGERLLCEKKIHWSGHGQLPEAVLRHVRENGTLPRHE